ncbi:MAG: SAM-dependent methyltransferase, partial [Gammaproteobacteria bacterium]|nr:SAM-dependent methyltransferase [Gammaproteobacteria bacterium]
MTQRNYRQAFGLKILNSNHAKVRHLKKEGYVAEIHGNKFWNSSFLI